MTNNTDAHENLQPDAVEELLEHSRTPGEMLCEAREAAGLSISQVADRLRLRQTLIKELEQNEFSKHVSDTYIRGYLRSYAKLLQLDETEIMAAYRQHFGDQKPAGAMQTFSNKKNIESQDNRLMVITWIIVLILIGSVAVFVWQQFSEDRAQSSSSSVNTQNGLIAGQGNGALPAQEASQEVQQEAERYNTRYQPTAQDAQPLNAQSSTPTELEATEEPSAVERAAAQTPGPSELPVNATNNTVAAQPRLEPTAVENTETAQRSGNAETAQSAETAQNTETAQSEQPEQRQETAQTNSSNATDPAALAELVLVFSGDSWVRIEDATGEAIAYGVKVDGYTMPLHGQAPYSLTLGAPTSVTVYFQGERVDISDFSGGRIARFNLPRND